MPGRDDARSVLLAGPAVGGVSQVATGAATALAARGWDVRHVRIPNGAVPLNEARRAFRRELGEIRSRSIVHVEHGSNDLAAFWFGLMAGRERHDLVTVAHDPPRIAHAPASGIIGGGSRARDIAGHRLLAPALDGTLRRVYARRAAVTLVLSERARRVWRDARPRELLVLPLGADRPVSTVPPSRGTHVLFAGYIGPGKGLDVLLAAWSRIGPSSPLPLVIAGSAPGAAGAAYLEQLGRPEPASNVSWEGPLADPAFALAIADAAIVVVPYRRSNPASGIVASAMAAGRAILGTDVPAVSDFLESGHEGLVVPVDDPGALAEALSLLIGDPELRDRLGAAAAARAPGWDDHCAALERAYDLARTRYREASR